MEKKKSLLILSKIIRILTLAPLLCLAASLIIYFSKPSYYASFSSFITSLLLLVVFPLLAYPTYYVFPCFKRKGREFQRKLAIIFAFISYIVVFGLSFVFKDSWDIRVYYFAYVFSSISIFFSTKILHFNISGHAAGVTGPIIYLSFYVSPWCLLGLVLIILVYLASLYMNRHTLLELIWGSLLPSICIIACYVIQNII